VITALLATGSIVLATLFVARAVAAQRRTHLSGRLQIEQVVPGARPASAGGMLIAAGAAVGWILCGRIAGVAGSVAATGAVLLAPRTIARRRQRRREHALQDQLAEAVSLIAGALRSGRSLHQAIELAADDLDAPLGATFRRLTDRTELGDPMERAIDDWAVDVGGPDARLVAGVLRLHRRTGGSLAATLDDLVVTLRDRRAAARELESLTAQARLSANILGLLPIGFFLFLSIVARRDLQTAYETPAGVATIGLGLGLQAVAFAWIRRLLRVEP
jgi:tight adherence protein B